jgi:hypothetical protein
MWSARWTWPRHFRTKRLRGEITLLLVASGIMKKALFIAIAIFLMIAGGTLLFIGATEGQGPNMLVGAGLAFLAGVVALLMQYGVFSERVGNILGIMFVVSAMVLAYRNYRDTHPPPIGPMGAHTQPGTGHDR